MRGKHWWPVACVSEGCSDCKNIWRLHLHLAEWQALLFFCLGRSNNKSVPDHTWNNAIHHRPVENHLIMGRFCRRD
jgi:hypothetical protein